MINLSPGSFVTYDPETGRILQSGSQAIGITNARIASGEYILHVASFIDVTDFDFYLNFYIDLKDRVLKTRPQIDWTFDKNSLLPMQEATLIDVPSCIIIFIGPKSGIQNHPSLADLKIGFKIPGVYVLTFEPFPYRPARFQLQVEPSGLASPAANVNLNLGVSL